MVEVVVGADILVFAIDLFTSGIKDLEGNACDTRLRGGGAQALQCNATVTEGNTTEISSSTEIENSKKEEKKPKKEGEPEIEEIPSYFADTVLNSMFFSYLEYRKENGKEVKGKAIGYCIDKLESLSNSPVEQVAIIKQTIQNGWTDFFPVKEKKEKEKKSGSNVSSWLEREKIQSTGGVFGD